MLPPIVQQKPLLLLNRGESKENDSLIVEESGNVRRARRVEVRLAARHEGEWVRLQLIDGLHHRHLVVVTRAQGHPILPAHEGRPVQAHAVLPADRHKPSQRPDAKSQVRGRNIEVVEGVAPHLPRAQLAEHRQYRERLHAVDARFAAREPAQDAVRVRGVYAVLLREYLGGEYITSIIELSGFFFCDARIKQSQ